MENRPTIFDHEKKNLPLGRVDQSFSDYFEENGMEVPPVKITILFSRHYNEGDVDWIKPYYKDTDIFVPEVAGWDEKVLGTLQAAAAGGKESKAINMATIPSQYRDLVQLMKRYQGKKITLVDLPLGSKLYLNVIGSGLMMSSYMDKALLPDTTFAEGAELRYSGVKAFAEENSVREKAIIGLFSPMLAGLIKENPNLSEKGTIRVLLTLGSAHTRLYQWIRDRGDEVTRAFQELPYEYSSGQAIMGRSVIFEKKPTKELIQKAFFSDVIVEKTFLKKSMRFLSEGEFDRYIGYICKNLSIDEMGTLFNNRGADFKIFQENFEKLLAEKGIPIIKTVTDQNQYHDWLKKGKGLSGLS